VVSELTGAEITEPTLLAAMTSGIEMTSLNGRTQS
jgi:hypothetical protein